MTDIFNLFVMEIEVTQRSDSVVLLFRTNIPKSQFRIIASSNYKSFFIRIPLKRVALCFMASQNYWRLNCIVFRFEFSFVKDMNFS